MDAELRPSEEDARRGAEYRKSLEPEHLADPFVAHRYEEGLRWRHVADACLSGPFPRRVLDLGAGNGAIELAFGADGRFVPVSVETLWNRDVVTIHRAAGAPLRRSLARGEELPFPDACFDLVLLLETIEHVREAARVGSEISRVTRGDGVILITTPPRYRYAFQPDPHFGIRGLVMLPPSQQRKMAAKRGYDREEHYVDRIYSSTGQIASLFPGCRIEETLSRSRAPKRWFWDAILLRRES